MLKLQCPQSLTSPSSYSLEIHFHQRLESEDDDSHPRMVVQKEHTSLEASYKSHRYITNNPDQDHKSHKYVFIPSSHVHRLTTSYASTQPSIPIYRQRQTPSLDPIRHSTPTPLKKPKTTDPPTSRDPYNFPPGISSGILTPGIASGTCPSTTLNGPKSATLPSPPFSNAILEITSAGSSKCQ